MSIKKLLASFLATAVILSSLSFLGDAIGFTLTASAASESEVISAASEDSDLPFETMPAVEIGNTPNLITNGDFENGSTGWDLSDTGGSAKVTKLTSGSNTTNVLGTRRRWVVSNGVALEKNTYYVLTVDVCTNATSADKTKAYFYIESDANPDGNGTIVAVDNRWDYLDDALNYTWVTKEVVFNSGDNTVAYLSVYEGNTTYWAYFDNFNLQKLGPADSVVLNGEFEFGKRYWEYDEDAFEKSTGESGYGIRIKSSYNSLLSQQIKLTANTKYQISFDYKGTIPSNKAFWAIGSENSMTTHTVIAREKLSSKTSWTNYKAVFNSGSLTNGYLTFQSALGSDCYVDNISITPVASSTATTVSALPNRAIYIGAAYGNYWSRTYTIPLKGYDLMKNSDFTTTSSETVNNATKFLTTSNKGTAAGTIVSGDNASYFGNSSLKFEAGSKTEYVSVPIKLEKNTEYFIGMYIKSESYYAKGGEFTRFSYGIADAETGAYIRLEDVTGAQSHAHKNYTDWNQNSITHDDSWHYESISFNTKDQTDFEILFRGCHATVYIDTLHLWNKAYGDPNGVPTTLKSLSDVTVTNTSPTKLNIVAGGENLVRNWNMEDAIDSYWSDKSKFVSSVYGDTLNIASSDDSFGKSLYYKNNRIYPTDTFYIKWIDVEPNTEYTFSAKYLIKQTGGGKFGVMSGYNSASLGICNHFDGSVLSENLVFPTIFASYYFSEENYKADESWQSVGISFNTKDRNRIGFYVLDGGGEAYIDDIKVFKTSQGTDALPNTVTNGGFEEGSTNGVANGWTFGNAQLATAQKASGKYSAVLKNGGSYFYQYIPVNKNTSYKISYDYKSSIGNDNLIVNGDFEDGLTGWNPEEGKSGYGIYQSDTGNSGNTTHTLRSLNTWIISDAIAVEPNTDYVLTFDARSSAPSASGTKTFLYIESDNVPDGKGKVSDHADKWDMINDAINNTWVTKTVEFNSGNNTVIYIGVDETNTGHSSYFDNFKLIEKNAAPSDPADTYASFSFCATPGSSYINTYVPENTRNNTATEWTTVSNILDSGNNECLCILFYMNGNGAQTSKYFDNIKIEEVTHTSQKLTTTGSYKFFYNANFKFDSYPQNAQGFGAKIWKNGTDEAAATHIDLTLDNLGVGISNISIYGIKNEFNVTPYIIRSSGEKTYCDTFTVSYAEWLLAHKDDPQANRKYIVEKINEILDLNYAATGVRMYSGQTANLPTAPTGTWSATVPYSVTGNSAIGLAPTTPIRGSLVNGKLRVNLDLVDETFVNPNLIVNGDFEDGMTGWNPEEGKTSGATIYTASSGTNLTKTLGSLNRWIVSDAITVEANTDYVLTFDARSTAPNESGTKTLVYIESDNQPDGKGKVSEHEDRWDMINDAINNTWITKEIRFNSGNNTTIYISIDESSTGYWSYFDNICLKKVMSDDSSPITNSTFEDDSDSAEWTFGNNAGTYAGGTSSLNVYPLDKSKTFLWFAYNSSYAYKQIQLKKNTYYTINFDYCEVSGTALPVVVHTSASGNGVENDKIIFKASGRYGTADNWGTASYTFFVSEDTTAWLTVYQSGNYNGDSTVYADSRPKIDNIIISPVSKGALVYKSGNDYDLSDTSNANANIMFGPSDLDAIDISGIGFNNLAKQYTIIPYIYRNGEIIYGNSIKVSYADFLAYALNVGNAKNKSIAYAFCELYEEINGTALCKLN
ncbi:MAG: hypothetical protein E7560_01815 [Ruminococcaceae bacterium]|nr:hypothetical protein [Oscillospiraceae bacterium]